MGEPLSPDRVFNFPLDEPHPAYAFFAHASLPEYVGDPNNNNGWLAADDYLLGELEAMVDEQMVIPEDDEIAEQMIVPAIKEDTEPVVEAKEEQVITPVADIVEGQMDAPMMDMEENLIALFGEGDEFDDDDLEDDAPNGFEEEEVWEVNGDSLMAPVTPPPMLFVPSPSIYEVGGPSTAVTEGPSFPHSTLGFPIPPCVVEDLSTRLGNLKYGHGQLVQRVNQVMATQVVQTVDRVEQIDAHVELGQQTSTQSDETIAELTLQMQASRIDVQQRDTQIQQLQTTVAEMSSRESTLMRCILGLEKRIRALEKRPPEPQ
ncbi:hypothetical protein Tco_1338432 [Tanacetum coccineum]